jgi:hypothetical protein
VRALRGRDAVPRKLHAKYKPMGFTMIGVNVEPDSRAAADWLKVTPVTFPILFDTRSEVSKLYSIPGMPSTVIVDRKGNLRWKHIGYKAGDENEYLNQIRTLVRANRSTMRRLTGRMIPILAATAASAPPADRSNPG